MLQPLEHIALVGVGVVVELDDRNTEHRLGFGEEVKSRLEFERVVFLFFLHHLDEGDRIGQRLEAQGHFVVPFGVGARRTVRMVQPQEAVRQQLGPSDEIPVEGLDFGGEIGLVGQQSAAGDSPAGSLGLQSAAILNQRKINRDKLLGLPPLDTPTPRRGFGGNETAGV